MRNGGESGRDFNSNRRQMVEDKLLMWRFKRGSREALRTIYDKYLDYHLTLAMALLNDVNSAEDVVHDVFVSFAGSAENIDIDGSLKGYLGASVLNRIRDRYRRRSKEQLGLDETAQYNPSQEPSEQILCSEESLQISSALEGLPDEQREVVVLRLKGGLKFKTIAELQKVSVNTVQGRYRYGIDKLRSILNGEFEK